MDDLYSTEQKTILRKMLGDLKLKDVSDAYGSPKTTDEYQYKPISKVSEGRNMIYHLDSEITFGSASWGVEIRHNNNDESPIFLIFGANRFGSPAQQIAVGCLIDSRYVFLFESYNPGELGRDYPALSTRALKIRRYLTAFPDEDDIDFEIYSQYGPINQRIKTLDPELMQLLENVLQRVRTFETAFKIEELCKISPKVRRRQSKLVQSLIVPQTPEVQHFDVNSGQSPKQGEKYL